MIIDNCVYVGTWEDGTRKGPWHDQYEEDKVDMTIKSESYAHGSERHDSKENRVNSGT